MDIPGGGGSRPGRGIPRRLAKALRKPAEPPRKRRKSLDDDKYDDEYDSEPDAPVTVTPPPRHKALWASPRLKPPPLPSVVVEDDPDTPTSVNSFFSEKSFASATTAAAASSRDSSTSLNDASSTSFDGASFDDAGEDWLRLPLGDLAVEALDGDCFDTSVDYDLGLFLPAIFDEE